MAGDQHQYLCTLQPTNPTVPYISTLIATRHFANGCVRLCTGGNELRVWDFISSENTSRCVCVLCVCVMCVCVVCVLCVCYVEYVYVLGSGERERVEREYKPARSLLNDVILLPSISKFCLWYKGCRLARVLSLLPMFFLTKPVGLWTQTAILIVMMMTGLGKRWIHSAPST